MRRVIFIKFAVSTQNIFLKFCRECAEYFFKHFFTPKAILPHSLSLTKQQRLLYNRRKIIGAFLVTKRIHLRNSKKFD